MTIAKKIDTTMSRQSWIRKMFEEGAKLKEKHGPENVFDFSLGNPNLAPPEEFHTVLKEIVNSSEHGVHGYMPNAGYPEVREAVAKYVSEEQRVNLSAADVIMTCGAAGALNVTFKTILDPGDVVITPSPYFVEYNAYVDNHGGILKTAPTNPDFTLNIDNIADAIDEKTKAILINSPNNPTGQIYLEDSLRQLGSLLESKGKELGRTLYLIADEPYRNIVYDGVKIPSIFSVYKDTILATSYSKNISIPGERIGFIAVNSQAEHREDLLNGMTLANRILGFVNAPALIQRVIARIQGITVDTAEYLEKRDMLCEGLAECGYEFTKPPGAFYLFPKTPVPDDVEFIKALQKQRILAVPGSGFGGPGHFRIAFCVDNKTIVNSMPGFKKAIDSYK
jgi:aspartate aminotransferase